MDTSIIQFIENSRANKTNEKIIVAAFIHLRGMSNKIRCNLVIETFEDKTTQLETFKILKEFLDTNKKTYSINTMAEHYVIYELIISLFNRGGREFKEQFNNKLQDLNEKFFIEGDEYAKNEKDLIEKCNMSKILFEGNNEIWKFLNI